LPHIGPNNAVGGRFLGIGVVGRGLVMGIAEGSVSVDGREIYVAKGLRVGLFASTDDF